MKMELIKKKKISLIELILKLSKNEYYIYPEYINLSRMSENEFSNIKSFKMNLGKFKILDKINLLVANLNDEYY